MEFEVTKLDVMQKIMNVSNVSLLRKIENILEDEMVVGYTVEGKPLTKELYNKRLEKAQNQILAGEFLSQEELEKESKSW